MRPYAFFSLTMFAIALSATAAPPAPSGRQVTTPGALDRRIEPRELSRRPEFSREGVARGLSRRADGLTRRAPVDRRLDGQARRTERSTQPASDLARRWAAFVPRTQGQRMLQERLAEIDLLRDQAIRRGDLDGLRRADRMEAVARRQNEPPRGNSEFGQAIGAQARLDGRAFGQFTAEQARSLGSEFGAANADKNRLLASPSEPPMEEPLVDGPTLEPLPEVEPAP